MHIYNYELMHVYNNCMHTYNLLMIYLPLVVNFFWKQLDMDFCLVAVCITF